jgi:uncharacterized protein (TIGR03437 family)
VTASVVDTVTSPFLLTSSVSGSVSCAVGTGSGAPATVTIKAFTPLTGSSTIPVTFATPGGGLVVTPTGGTTLNAANNSTGITYSVNTAAGTGCNGNSSGTTVLQFKASGVNDVTASVVDSVTSPYQLNAAVSGPITCSTVTGPGPAATITVSPFTPLSGSSTLVVSTASVGGGLVLTAPSNLTLNATTNLTLVYTVKAAAGCVGTSTGNTTVQFKAGGANDIPVSIADTLTNTTSGLVATPASIALTCTLSGVGGTYTVGVTQTISVTSAAAGGIAFTLDSSAANKPAWITTSASPGGTASGTAVTFTVAPTAGCGGFLGGSTHSVNLHLVNAPAPDLLIPVTLQIVAPSILTVTPVPAAPTIAMSYIKGSGNVATANVSVTSSIPSVFVSINTASLPNWLTVDNTSGTAPWSLRFSTTSFTDSLAPGSYSATVFLRVAGYADTPAVINLQVNNKPPKLSVGSTTVNLSWVLGTVAPTATITATSSDSPIPYTITTGGTLAPIVSAAQQAGLAYSFGTQIAVSFNSLAFASAQPGSVLTGTVTLTWGSPASTTVVTFLVSVSSPGATLTGLTPATEPTAAPLTSFVVNLSGTGFVGGTDPTMKTRVGIVQSGSIVVDPNLSYVVVNPSNILLTIVVPTVPDANLPFSSGGNVYLGIVNGNASNIPTGTATLAIGTGPIIQGITSASSFTEVAPAAPTFAPYDMISIFGANFCSSSQTGCGSTTILPGAPDTLTLRYPTTLALPAPDATGRVVSVTFLNHTDGSILGNAPLLFATNNQINAIVPGIVSTVPGPGTVDVVVNFGYGTVLAGTLLSSTPFNVNIATSDPGIFTVASDGQGAGAVLDSNYALITSSNPAAMRSGSGDSDYIQIYVTGLGAPDSTGDNTQTSQGCIAATTGTGNYMAALNAASNVSPALSVATGGGVNTGGIDGAVVQSALLNTGNLPPCLATPPTVYIGGVAAGTPTYAGFVPDTVAGLYQIDVKLPVTTGTFYPNFDPTLQTQGTSITNLTQPVQLPVHVKVGNTYSQNNVTVWVAPRLKVTDPLGNVTSNPLDLVYAEVGVSYSGSVTATEGGTATYLLTSGNLPAGLTLAPSTGVISGTPTGNPGSYTLTITATDNSTPALTGKVTFTLVVAGALTVLPSGAPPYIAVYGTPLGGTPTVTATGGTAPYTYTMTFAGTGTPSSPAIASSTGIVSTTSTAKAGTYHVTVTATDANGITGHANFDIVISLLVTYASDVVTATGGSGTLTYALSGAGGAAGLAIDSSGNVTVGTASTGVAYNTIVTVNDTVTLAPGASVEGTGTATFSVTF